MSFLMQLNPFAKRQPSRPLGGLTSARRVSIISLLSIVVVLGGCSALRLGYNNAPTVAYWWLDRYFDFDAAQSVRVRADLKALHDWHRAEELPRAAELLRKLRQGTPQDTSAELLCGLYGDVKDRGVVGLERMVPTLAAVVPTLQDAQIARIASQFDKRNQDWREEWLDGTPAQRAERRVKKMLSRAETFYGDLSPEQTALVPGLLGASGNDADTLFQERLLRQKDALQTLRTLRDTPNTTPAQREAAIQALLDRAVQPTDPLVRQALARWSGQGCAVAAALHNSSSPAQRLRMADTLQRYEGDVQALIAQR
jgi:hypothetical protein